MLMDIKGHILILKMKEIDKLLVYATQSGYLPFSVSLESDGLYQLSHPLSPDERIGFRWLYAKVEAQNKLAKLNESDDNTPPDLLA